MQWNGTPYRKSLKALQTNICLSELTRPMVKLPNLQAYKDLAYNLVVVLTVAAAAIFVIAALVRSLP